MALPPIPDPSPRKRGPRKAAPPVGGYAPPSGAFKFKKSKGANSAEMRNRTDAEGRSGFGANTFGTRPQGTKRTPAPKSNAFRTPKSRVELSERMKLRKIYGLRLIDRSRPAFKSMKKGK